MDFFKKDNTRRVYMLIDRSGSMSTEWKSTVESINAYVKKLEDDVMVYVAIFDNNYGHFDYTIVRYELASEFKMIEPAEFMPRGGTPLFDAAALIMNKMLDDNPEKAILVIMTDGEENSSTEHKLTDVKAKLGELEKRQWPVTYLGANFKEVERYATGTYGIDLSNVLNTSSAMRSVATASLGTKSMNYFNAADESVGYGSLAFTDEEKAELDQ